MLILGILTAALLLYILGALAVSAVTSQQIASKFAITLIGHVPNSTNSVPVTPNGGTTLEWLEMGTYEWFAFEAANAVLTGNGLTAMSIMAATDNLGTNATAIVSSGVLSGTLVTNGGFLECTAAQIREVGSANSMNFKYVTGYATVQNASDVAAAMLLRGMSRYPTANLTPATF